MFSFTHFDIRLKITDEIRYNAYRADRSAAVERGASRDLNVVILGRVAVESVMVHGAGCAVDRRIRGSVT